MELRVAAAVAVAFGTMTLAAAAAAQEPKSLEECYLRVAMQKSTADAIHLAREICDAVYKPAPRAVAVLSPKNGKCTEWWFDHHERYESEKHYCAFEEMGEDRFRLACQWKGQGEKRVTYVELREEGDRYVRVGELRGTDVGQLFKGLAGCVGAKVGGGAATGG